MKQMLILMLFSTALTGTYLLPTTSTLTTLILNTVLWTGILLIISLHLHTKHYHIWKKHLHQKTPNFSSIVILITLFHLCIYLLTGIVSGFARNTLINTPHTALCFFILLLSYLLTTELSRGYLLQKTTYAPQKRTRNYAAITLLFASLTIIVFSPPSQTITTPRLLLQFSIATIIPTIAIGLFASALNYYAGARYSLTYMIPLTTTMFLSPLLPNTPFMMLSLLNTIIPLIGFLLLQHLHTSFSFELQKKRLHQRAFSWTTLFLFSTTAMSLSTGLLGIQPVVVIGGSMQPTFDVGDIIIVADVPHQSITEGDIIHYQTPQSTVSHRVINKTLLDDQLYAFTTKGDANQRADPFSVYSAHVHGKIVFSIPDIGWIAIHFQQFLKKIGTLISSNALACITNV